MNNHFLTDHFLSYFLSLFNNLQKKGSVGVRFSLLGRLLLVTLICSLYTLTYIIHLRSLFQSVHFY
jgi:hypothetical protein